MTTAATALLCLIPAAYLLSSVPYGLLVAKTRGVDPRTAGSGNIGATNVGRLLGKKFFAIVFILDLLKGLLPTLAAAFILAHSNGPATPYSAADYLLWLLVAFAAVCGHMFSVFLKFKGGKGIATSLGVMLGMYPFFTLPAIPVFAVWLVVFLSMRYVSLASIIGACTFPIWFLIVGYWRDWPVLDEQLPLTIFAFVVAGLIVVKHRGNIRRLKEGREPHYHPAKKPEPVSAD